MLSVKKAILVMYGTYVALRSTMFERSCMLPNIEALPINSPVPPVIAEDNAQKLRPFLCTFLFTKYICKKGCDQCILANFLA